jgi:transcriptional regulator with XRE-family HTH domain
MVQLVAVKKRRAMTEEQVVIAIRKGQDGESLRDYAARIGISAAYLSDIYAGKRSPGRKCLDFFGISKKRIVEYRYVFEGK